MKHQVTNSLNCLLCTIHQHSGPDLSLCEEQESVKHVKHPGGGLVNGGDNHLILFACQRRDELKEGEGTGTVQTRCRLLRRMGVRRRVSVSVEGESEEGGE